MNSETFTPGHVGLNVTDLQRSRKFYETVFRMDVLGESVESGKRFAFLGKNGRPLLTLWEQSRERFDRSIPGLHHLAFEVESLDRVEQIRKELEKMEVRFVYSGAVAHSEKASSGGIYFEDPDGIRLEIYTPNGASSLPAVPGGAPACGFF